MCVESFDVLQLALLGSVLNTSPVADGIVTQASDVDYQLNVLYQARQLYDVHPVTAAGDLHQRLQVGVHCQHEP